MQYAIRAGIADAKRICIIGSGYGGYAALMGTVKTPDLYRCAVSLGGSQTCCRSCPIAVGT